MHFNWQSHELNLKIVYYGPALSGKTTNLEQIHRRLDPGRRSELVSLKTHEDRTLFFDFMELELGKIGGLMPKIRLYTVPGQTYYEASRRLVLRGADGVVFVADSNVDCLEANLEAWTQMHDHLASFEMPVSQTPLVVQCNKQDMPSALSVPILKRLLQVDGIPMLPSVATRGDGVLETLRAITLGVMSRVEGSIA